MSSPFTHEQVEQILGKVLEHPACDQPELIDRYCGDNIPLLNEIRSLIAHRSRADELLHDSLVRVKEAIRSRDQPEPCYPLISGFEILRILGQGGNGIVYLAQQQRPSRLVAIKVLKSSSHSSDAHDRMLAEGHYLARLRHPSIACLYEVGELESSLFTHLYFVMEYVDGTPLSSPGALTDASSEQISRVLLCLCEAIRHAHNQGIAHRDIKPSNIMLTRDSSSGEISLQVIDFGIAKLIRGEPIPLDLQTETGGMLGTRRYMSPERISGDSNGGDILSDMYSIGVIAQDLIDTHGCSDRLAKVLERIAKRMTMKNPADRYQSLDEVIRALGASGQRSLHARSLRPFTRKAATGIAVGIGIGIIAWKGIHGLPVRVKHPKAISEAGATPYFRPSQPVHQLLASENLYDRWWANRYIASSLVSYGNAQQGLGLLRDFEDQAGDLTQRSYMHYRHHLLIKAACYQRLGNWDQAIFALQSARDLTQIGPDMTNNDAFIWMSIAHGYQECGELSIAKSMYEQLMKHPGLRHIDIQHMLTVRQYYAGLLWLLHDYPRAEREFAGLIQTLSDLDPKIPMNIRATVAKIYSSHGVTLIALSRFEEAEKQMIQSLNQIDGLREATGIESTRIYRNLATCYLLSGKYEQARDRASILYSIWSPNIDTLTNETADSLLIWGSAELGMGDPEQAIPLLRQCIELTTPHEGRGARRARALAENALGAAMIAVGDVRTGEQLLKESATTIRREYGDDHPWVYISDARLAGIGG